MTYKLGVRDQIHWQTKIGGSEDCSKLYLFYAVLVVSTGVVWLEQWVSHSNQPPLSPHLSLLILMPKGQCTLRLNLHLQSPWLAWPQQETAIVQKPLPQSRLAVSTNFRTAIKYLKDIFLKKLQMTQLGLNQCMPNA